MLLIYCFSIEQKQTNKTWFPVQNTVKVGYNEVPGTFKTASLYEACVLTEAADITNTRHAHQSQARSSQTLEHDFIIDKFRKL